MGKRVPKNDYRRKPKHKLRFLKPNQRPTVKNLVRIGHEKKCVCCGSTDDLTFDHILPKARGGKNHLDNGQILCKRCNNHKADRRISLFVLKIEIEEAENLKSKQIKTQVNE